MTRIVISDIPHKGVVMMHDTLTSMDAVKTTDGRMSISGTLVCSDGTELMGFRYTRERGDRNGTMEYTMRDAWRTYAGGYRDRDVMQIYAKSFAVLAENIRDYVYSATDFNMRSVVLGNPYDGTLADINFEGCEWIYIDIDSVECEDERYRDMLVSLIRRDVIARTRYMRSQRRMSSSPMFRDDERIHVFKIWFEGKTSLDRSAMTVTMTPKGGRYECMIEDGRHPVSTTTLDFGFSVMDLIAIAHPTYDVLRIRIDAD